MTAARKAGKRKAKASRQAPDSAPLALAPALLANLVILAVLLLAAALRGADSDLYYRAVSEDEFLEWGTVWAFVIAGGIFFWAAAFRRRAGGGVPWFFLGVGLFCLVFALEEISWGQRILGYRPPSYFLEHNFQQEFNFHNIMDTGLRKLTLKAIILGYGVVLPILAAVRETRRLLDRLGIVAPPAGLIPGFLAAFFAYESYPWSFTGELVELMLGLGFLFAGLHAAGALERTGLTALGKRLPAAAVVGVAAAVVVGLGFANAAYSRVQRAGSPGALEAAETEVAALKADFARLARGEGDSRGTRCNVHKRVFSWVEKYDGDDLYEGRFAALAAQGLPEERAQFFIDPWNSPYWIRHKCSKSRERQVSFVYSFGPNRRRDSTDWELGGDDVGAMILERRR